ncbi:SDR family oxidoreductase [Tsukamurella sp. PLM1]|uniref:SDR family oxidoreductase n=1 Tax=Tsukamurella sp. PLM1 TaxID=2929795 RepID=UPI0020C0A0BB|nr:SDR family oxidoreductase [Tsukamurella sp. PLM1]
MGLGLDGAVVLVTGGVRGIGAGIARVFLRHGATVVVCARREPESPVAVGGADGFGGVGGADGFGGVGGVDGFGGVGGAVAEFVAADVRDPEQVDALVAGIIERYGRLDVLVNNAGGAPYSDAANASPRFHEKVVGLNLLAPLLVAQRANAVMQVAGRGAIVNISSVSATRPSPGTAAYGAAKAGLDSLTTSLAVEWAPAVRVNALDVGMVRTEAAEQHYGDDAGIAAIGATVPLGRLADPEEVGECAAFLASPLASYVTGATLLVHGGGERPAFLAAATVDNGAERPNSNRTENQENRP